MIDSILVVTNTFDDISVESDVLSETDVTLTSVQTDSVDEVVELGTDADVILVQGIEFDRKTIRALSHIEAIGVYGTGTDDIDIDAADEHGIKVINVPQYGVDEVSTHALSLILASSRKLGIYDNHVRSGGWDWETGAPLFRPNTMTIGLVAYGKIAQALAGKCTPLFDEIVAFDPYLPEEESDVMAIGFNELLKRADIVSIHCPLTEETVQLFGTAEFRQMKDTAVLVNTSRGEIVNVDALYSALTEGEIAYAGIDVLPSEPPGELLLFELDNVLITPHIGWYSEKAADELRRTLVEDIRRLVDGREANHLVNDHGVD